MRKPKNGIICAACFILVTAMSTSTFAAVESRQYSMADESTVVSESEHIWGDWIVEKESTCIEHGIRYRVCTRYPESPHVEYEQLPLAEHKYVVSKTVEATCEKNGYVEYKCEVCGDTYREVLPATGHDYGDWIVDKEAAPGVAGHKYKVCQNDSSHVIEQVIPALPVKAETPIVPEVIPEEAVETEPAKPEEAVEIEPAKPEETVEAEPERPEVPVVEEEPDMPEAEPVNVFDIVFSTGGMATAMFMGMSIFADYRVIWWDRRKKKLLKKIMEEKM